MMKVKDLDKRGVYKKAEEKPKAEECKKKRHRGIFIYMYSLTWAQSGHEKQKCG